MFKRVGDYVMHISFMSTSTVPSKACGFTNGNKYLVEVTIK